jgi:hypothetical protein
MLLNELGRSQSLEKGKLQEETIGNSDVMVFEAENRFAV